MTSTQFPDPGEEPTESGIPKHPPSPVAPESKIGVYQLVEQIGEGGMGVVYLAEQTEPIRRQLALKIVKPGLDSARVIARFEAERQALALMDHPNISQVFDAGVAEDKRPYFVMELVLGLPITEYCNQQAMNVRDRANLMMTVCHAVQHAHQKGIAHRDIKPSNVIVVESEQGPVPKVIDFGVAKAIEAHDAQDADLTLDGHAVGTPLHMSPEQAKLDNSDVDTRTDVYSLGVLLYELLTDTTPILRARLRDMDLDDLRQVVRQEEPPKPSARLRELGAEIGAISRARGTDQKGLMQAVRGDLDQIVLKALAKDRDLRYPTANALASDIKRHLDCRPIEATAPSNLYRLRKYVERHKAALATIVFVAVVLVVAAIYSMWQAHKTANALRLAEASARRLSELLYVSDMKLASDAWADNDTPRVAGLLQRHRPLATEPDHRRFEWYYLSRLVDIESLEIDLASGDVETIRFSPDGRWLAAGGRDGQVRIYEWSTLEAPTIVESGQIRVNDLCFAPGGQRVATAGHDGTLRVWDFVDGKLEPVGEAIKAHDESVTGVVFAAGGELLVSCGDDTQIRLWDATRLGQADPIDASELQVAEFDDHDRGVEALAVSPDGWQLASASNDATLCLWDLERQQLVQMLKHDNARVVCVAWSADGQTVAAGDIHGNVIVYDCQSKSSRVLAQLLDGVESLVFLDSDQCLATGDRGGSIQLWPLADAEDADRRPDCQTYPRWQAHKSRVTALALSDKGKHIVSGSRTGQVCRWSAQPEECRWSIGGADQAAHDFAFADRRRRLVVARETAVELWDLDTRTVVASWGKGQGPWVNVAMNPESDTVITGNVNGEIVAWNLGSPLGNAVTETERWPCPESVRWERISLSPDGRWFAAAAWDRREEAWIFDLDAKDRSWRVPATQSRFAAFSSDGDQLAVANMDDGILYAWKKQTSLFPIQGHSNTLSDLAFSPDGKMLATVSHDRKLCLWDIEDGQRASERYMVVAHQDWVRCVAFAADGWSLITSGDDGHARLWHAKTGQLLLELPDEGDSIWKARFSPDGRRIACYTADGRIVVYDSMP